MVTLPTEVTSKIRILLLLAVTFLRVRFERLEMRKRREGLSEIVRFSKRMVSQLVRVY